VRTPPGLGRPSGGSGEWPSRCADVRFEMGDDHYEESGASAQPGDLLWDMKGGEGHVLTDRAVSVTEGWTTYEEQLCECLPYGLLGDHHVVILARKPPDPEEEP
jgi:hypothetical protein